MVFLGLAACSGGGGDSDNNLLDNGGNSVSDGGDQNTEGDTQDSQDDTENTDDSEQNPGGDNQNGGDDSPGTSNRAATIINVGNTVVTENILHLGINLGTDNYWDAPLTKNRVHLGGFEGVLYRHIARGPGGDAQSLYDWNDFNPSSGGDELSGRSWLDIVTGANAWVLAGDRAWQQETISSVEHAAFPGREDEGERLRFVFADSGEPIGADNGEQLNEVGLLIEKVEADLGYIGQHGGPLWAFASDGAEITTSTDDPRPGTQGNVVAVLAAPGAETAKLMYPLLPNNRSSVNGTWLVSFWAKGDGALTLGYGDWGTPDATTPISLSSSWQHFENIPLTVSNYSDNMLDLHFSATGGTVKLDEITAQMQGEANPTAFRDEIVEVLEDLQPGVLRAIFMGGSSVDNQLKPSTEQMAFSFRRQVPPDATIPWPGHPNTNGNASFHTFNLHEFLQLNQHLNSQPWYCITGTVFPEEMENLMEYLAGPASSTYGQIRASYGQTQPWTEVFDEIHIEIGNEAWNWAPPYAYGGWNGAEYWTRLFNDAKAKLGDYAGALNRVKFHVGAQNYNTWLGQRLVADHGAAGDYYAIAPYVIHEMNSAQAAYSDEDLFSWVFGWVWHLNTGGPMQNNADMVADSGHDLEFSVYEVNHHITGGDASTAARNRVVTSIGGALNALNHMLLMVERYDVKVQNFFTLFQDSYDGVGLWGSVLNAKDGEERYRPTYLALMLANRVLNGDLVSADKSGEDPSWQVSFDYSDETINTEVPFIHAYATRNGKQRGLILLNLHRSDALPIELALPAAAQASRATQWSLTADSITANNELEHAPQVSVAESAISNFTEGYTADLPPHSLTVLSWQEQ